MIQIVLIEPEIPQNASNIAQTCAATGCQLHLIKPLGFSLSDRQFKRSGLDFSPHLDMDVHESFNTFWARIRLERFWLVSPNSGRTYTETNLEDDAYILFGRESTGLPESLLSEHPDRCLRIPTRKDSKGLVLSNAVVVVIYESLRQSGFHGL